jgi:hypothetical protein
MRESIGDSSPALTRRESSSPRSTSLPRVAEGRDSRGYVEERGKYIKPDILRNWCKNLAGD